MYRDLFRRCASSDGDGREMGIGFVYVSGGVNWVGVSGDDVVNGSEIDSASFCSLYFLLVIYFVYGKEENKQ